MGDKRKYNSQNPRIPVFTERFRREVDKMGGISKVAQHTGISRPTISFWYNGERTPDAEKMRDLANAFDVSIDYLLGITDIPSRDPTIQAICEYTGLSEKATKYLNKLKDEFPRRIEVLNDMIHQNGFDNILLGMANLSIYDEMYPEIIKRKKDSVDLSCIPDVNDWQIWVYRRRQELNGELWALSDYVKQLADQLYHVDRVMKLLDNSLEEAKAIGKSLEDEVKANGKR